MFFINLIPSVGFVDILGGGRLRAGPVVEPGGGSGGRARLGELLVLAVGSRVLVRAKRRERFQ